MSVVFGEKDRNVIPRWRDFLTTAHLGELHAAATITSYTDVHDLSTLISDWTANRSVSFAADLISAAVVSRTFPAAQEAANFVLESDNIPPSLRALAELVRYGKQVDNAVTEQAGIGTHIRHQQNPRIAHIRRLLSDHSSDAILWVDFAYHYALEGLIEKAERAIRIALNLAPENRFVLRSASRFFIHRGRPDTAHELIRSSKRAKHDPWLLSAEVATALAAKRTPWNIREGQSALASGRFAPQHLTELNSALGSLEFKEGSSSKAKKLVRRSLEAPNENSLAQAEWLSSRLGGRPIEVNVRDFAIERPFEAEAFEAYSLGEWNRAYLSALKWLKDQPFSSRPAEMASFIASTLFEDFEDSVQIAKFGLIANPHHPSLTIGLIYAYAATNRMVEAKELLKTVRPDSGDNWVPAAIDANYGLIAFREGNIAQGRLFYAESVRKADLLPKKKTKAAALMNWASEELKLGGNNLAEHLLEEMTETSKIVNERDNDYLLARVRQRVEAKRNEYQSKD
jgi:hypothetical protein